MLIHWCAYPVVAMELIVTFVFQLSVLDARGSGCRPRPPGAVPEGPKQLTATLTPARLRLAVFIIGVKIG